MTRTSMRGLAKAPIGSERIMAVSDIGTLPMFDTEPLGPPSPSNSLLIETHRPKRGVSQARWFSEQILTLFLDAGVVQHAQDGGAPVAIAVPTSAAVLSLREHHERVRWLEPGRVMSVRVTIACSTRPRERWADRGAGPSAEQ